MSEKAAWDEYKQKTRALLCPLDADEPDEGGRTPLEEALDDAVTDYCRQVRREAYAQGQEDLRLQVHAES